MNQPLRVALLARVQSPSLPYHSESPVGDTIYRVYQDSSTVVGIMPHLRHNLAAELECPADGSRLRALLGRSLDHSMNATVLTRRARGSR